MRRQGNSNQFQGQGQEARSWQGYTPPSPIQTDRRGMARAQSKRGGGGRAVRAQTAKAPGERLTLQAAEFVDSNIYQLASVRFNLIISSTGLKCAVHITI